MVAIKAQVPIKPLGLYSAMFIMSWCLFLSPSASYSRSNFVSNYLSLTIALAESVQDGQIGEEAEIGSTNKVMYDKDTVTGSAEAEEEWLWEEDDMQGTLSSVTENLRVIAILSDKQLQTSNISYYLILIFPSRLRMLCGSYQAVISPRSCSTAQCLWSWCTCTPTGADTARTLRPSTDTLPCSCLR